VILDEIVQSFAQGDRGITHLLAARGGRVIGEWYAPLRSRTSPHMLHSATKSFIGTGIGLAIDEGRLSLEDRLVDFLTDAQVRGAEAGIEEITIADMLTMRTGHASGTSGVVWRNLRTSWIDAYLRVPVSGIPGKDFMYSSGTSHMLSVCLQKATGLPADEYLRARLFEPLGFAETTWDKDPEGYCSGGNGLSINVVDFLKWGQLYLDRGRWEGRQIVPAEWVDTSLARHVNVGSLVWTGDGFDAIETDDAEAGPGYGYQIWNRQGGAYADGIFGQYCVILPEADTVVAVFSSMMSKQSEPFSAAVINAARSAEMTAFVPPFSGTLTADADSDTHVVAGILDGVFTSPDGDTSLSFSVESTENGALVSVRGHDSAGALDFAAGIGHQHESIVSLGAPSLHHSYTERTRAVGVLERRGPWSVEIVLTYPVTPFTDRFSFHLETDGVLRYNRSVNVNSQDTAVPDVVLRRTER
jgi:CubicO group peptidase (beta-lactamase class C family)